jgi:membrane protein YqaA with SNARE-associated domain
MTDAARPDSPPGRTHAFSAHVLAFIWGLAEATVFFIVPDVLLTRLALSDFRRALVACLWAVAGALFGGTALWFAARHDATQFFLNAFDWLPGISRGLIVRIAQALHTDGLTALATGALSGQPYKLYAVHAGAQDIPLTGFLIVSAVASFVRFTLAATVAWLAGRVLHHLPEASRLRLHLYCWLIFYSCYFVVMG